MVSVADEVNNLVNTIVWDFSVNDLVFEALHVQVAIRFS